MAEPTESILLIATETNGADGFVNKVAPEVPITNLGFAKQGLPYQYTNYLFNNQASWLKYINEEQIPEETTARESADTALQGNIDTEESARSDADTTLQTNIDNEETARTDADALHVADLDPHTQYLKEDDLFVTTHVLNHADVIPLPAGYSRAQLQILLSARDTGATPWRLDETVLDVHYRIILSHEPSTGVITAYREVYDKNGLSLIQETLTVNVLVIARKGL